MSKNIGRDSQRNDYRDRQKGMQSGERLQTCRKIGGVKIGVIRTNGQTNGQTDMQIGSSRNKQTRREIGIDTEKYIDIWDRQIGNQTDQQTLKEMSRKTEIWLEK